MYSGVERVRGVDGLPSVLLTESQIRHLPGISDFHIELLLTGSSRGGELFPIPGSTDESGKCCHTWIGYRVVEEYYMKKYLGEDWMSWSGPQEQPSVSQGGQ